jgi:hypothetical protein
MAVLRAKVQDQDRVVGLGQGKLLVARHFLDCVFDGRNSRRSPLCTSFT